MWSTEIPQRLPWLMRPNKISDFLPQRKRLKNWVDHEITFSLCPRHFGMTEDLGGACLGVVVWQRATVLGRQRGGGGGVRIQFETGKRAIYALDKESYGEEWFIYARQAD